MKNHASILVIAAGLATVLSASAVSREAELTDDRVTGIDRSVSDRISGMDRGVSGRSANSGRSEVRDNSGRSPAAAGTDRGNSGRRPHDDVSRSGPSN
ncbi:MAG: hypothetical protein RLZZ200_959 [Pseudomonadota bacterium]|jgi:hypothetical protein